MLVQKFKAVISCWSVACRLSIVYTWYVESWILMPKALKNPKKSLNTFI